MKREYNNCTFRGAKKMMEPKSDEEKKYIEYLVKKYSVGW
jgi:hypothetical protein